MKGQNVLKHPDRDEITKMLNDGYSPEEVSKHLSQKHKHKMYHLSDITLQYYRQNFLKLAKPEIAQRRKELLESGNTKELNALDSFSAASGFIEAKEKAAAEIINALENFKSIQDKVLERINLIDESTKDDNGKMVYKPRNEEILEKYLGRLESMTNSFIKMQEFINKKNLGPQGTTEIQITMNEMNKYSDFYKTVMQKTLVRIDPTLINDFLITFNEEKDKLLEEQGLVEPNKVNISINNGNDTRISVSTSPETPNTSTIKIEPQNPPKEFIDLEEQDSEDEDSE